MSYDELEAIRRRVSQGSIGTDARFLLAELDRKTLLLERYGRQLDEVRDLTGKLEDQMPLLTGPRAQVGLMNLRDRLRDIVGPR